MNTSRGGVPKTSVAEARVSTYGFEGDHQRDLRYHGGSDRAVCLYSLELIHALQQEGHTIVPGAAGENLTVSGIDWPSMTPGRELTVGAARLQITSYAAPCENLRDLFRGGNISRIAQKRHPGWSRVYARVLEPGVVRPGDTMELCQ